MSAIRERAITAFGQIGATFDPIVVGETTRYTVSCQDPITKAPRPFAVGEALQIALCRLDDRRQPTYPPEVSHQATITSPSTGIAQASIIAGDLIQVGEPLPAGQYWLEFVIVDGLGDRLSIVSAGKVALIATGILPGTPVTPLPAQQPLGLASFSVTTTKTSAYTAKVGELVVCDPSAGGFEVAGPAGTVAGDYFAVANESDSANEVTVNANGSETLGGLLTVTLGAREMALFVKGTGTNWSVLS